VRQIAAVMKHRDGAILLERALRKRDDPNARAVLQQIVATGNREAIGAVLEALVSDDPAFDFPQRDDFFCELLEPVADVEVGTAALHRLRWEIERGATSDGEIGGYALLVGAAGTPQGRAFLQDLLDGRYGGGASLCAAGLRGLAATGDPAVLETLARDHDLGEDAVAAWLRHAGPDGWRILGGLATAPATARIAWPVARLSARERRPETGALLERMWDQGSRRAALEGCMALRAGTLREDEAVRLREIVYGAARADADTSVRRGALYAIEYSEVFQTGRAADLLEQIIASEPRTWANAARPALRNTEETLRRK